MRLKIMLDMPMPRYTPERKWASMEGSSTRAWGLEFDFDFDGVEGVEGEEGEEEEREAE
jgi:hypothetical protein